MRAYGKEGYHEIVENNIDQVKKWEKFIADIDTFELLAPVRLNTECFTLKNSDSGKISTFITRINSTGKVFFTHTVYNQKYGARAALVNWRTKHFDVELVWKEMSNIVKAF